jgi:hypothetical protein
MTLVTAVSLAPLDVKIALRTAGHWHNAIHLTVFFFTGLMLLADAAKPSARAARAVALFMFCCVLEWLQAVLYHNSVEWRDIFVDTLAIACSLAIAELLAAVRSAQRVS